MTGLGSRAREVMTPQDRAMVTDSTRHAPIAGQPFD